jgi:hypothetical protein
MGHGIAEDARRQLHEHCRGDALRADEGDAMKP